jgi:hypothetical protein
MLRRGVIVAGQRQNLRPSRPHRDRQTTVLFCHMPLLPFCQHRQHLIDFFMAPATLAGDVSAVVINIAPLTLTGSVVHQRHQRQPFIQHKWCEISRAGQAQQVPGVNAANVRHAANRQQQRWPVPAQGLQRLIAQTVGIDVANR